jgi:hypothetical protein
VVYAPQDRQLVQAVAQLLSREQLGLEQALDREPPRRVVRRSMASTLPNAPAPMLLMNPVGTRKSRRRRPLCDVARFLGRFHRGPAGAGAAAAAAAAGTASLARRGLAHRDRAARGAPSRPAAAPAVRALRRANRSRPGATQTRPSAALAEHLRRDE